MTQTTHNDNLVIDGSHDVTQLTVEGAANQTTPLQKWQDGDQRVVAQISDDGYFQVGDDLDAFRPSALVNIRRDRPAPMQGLSTQARFSGAINTVLQWVSHKLELLGANGVSRRVSALRVQLTHNNSGPSTDADLQAGDFEVVTQQSAGQAVALHAAVTNQAGATLTNGIGVQIDLQNAGTLTNAYGLKIEDVDQATTNYAIHTGQGQVEFGGDVEVRGQLRAPTFTPTAAGLVPSPDDATGRFLKDDGTWAAIPTADGGQSPWSTNRRGIHYDTGRVGIGTDNPREDLHVVGDICIDGDAEFAEDIEVKGDVRIDGTLSGPTFTPTEDGLVPKPGTPTGRFLKDDGTWAPVPTPPAPTIPTFTSQAAGLVPSPGDSTGRYLKDDGTWGTITPLQLSPWTKTGNDLHYNNGKVGIGGTPSNRLEVVDGNVSVSQRTEGTSAWARVKANAAPAYLQLEDSSSDNLWQMVHDGENANKLKIDYFDGTTKTTPLQIEKSAPTNSVYIKSDGKVGIGTDKSRAHLEISDGPKWSASNLGLNLLISGKKNNAIGFLDFRGGNPWAISNLGERFEFLTMPAIGNVAIGRSAKMVIHRNGNVGIGTIKPAKPLHVASNQGIRIGNSSQYLDLYTYGYGVDIKSSPNHNLYLGSRLVHVGSHTPGLKFLVTGNSRITGSCTAASFLRSSDESLKSNIQDIRTPLQLVSQLRGRTYTRNTTSSPETGFIAQEVQQALPDAVSEDHEGQKCVDYSSVIPILVEAIKELDAKIAAITT